MGMSAIGVGSGLDLEGLVLQLVQVERAPKVKRLDDRKKEADVQLSALGQLKSALNKVNTSLDSLGDPKVMGARSAQVTGQPTDNPFINVSTSNQSVRGNYNVEVVSLAQGSRLTTDGAFTSSADEVTPEAGQLTFQLGDDGDTFTVDIEANATVADIADAVNRAAENFGVNASVINTGGADPQTYLVFDSPTTGAGNTLSMTGSTPALQGLIASMDIDKATDAEIKIDGISSFSATNTFENAVENLTITANRVSPADEQARIAVDVDKAGVKEQVDEFMSAYNSMIDEVNRLTRYNADGTNGPLIGDSIVRSVRGQLAGILGQPVDGAASGLNTLFQLGITQDKDGKLQFDTRNIGGGTGQERFDRAVDEQFDDIIALFSGDNGIGTRLQSALDQYTRSDGLIDGREKVAKNQQERVTKEREQLDRFMEQYERNLRQRYTALDMTIASLNSNADFLFQRLNQM